MYYSPAPLRNRTRMIPPHLPERTPPKPVPTTTVYLPTRMRSLFKSTIRRFVVEFNARGRSAKVVFRAGGGGRAGYGGGGRGAVVEKCVLDYFGARRGGEGWHSVFRCGREVLVGEVEFWG